MVESSLMHRHTEQAGEASGHSPEGGGGYWDLGAGGDAFWAMRPGLCDVGG